MLRGGMSRTDVYYMLAVGVGVGLSWLLTIALGGAGVVAPHWFYLPIVLTAYRFGPRATLAVSCVTAFVCGPLLPDHFANGVAVDQATSDWVTRGIAFVLLGQAIAFLFARLRRDRDGARDELAQRRLAEDTLAQQDARFAAMIRRSSDLTTIVSAEGLIVYQSPSSIQLLGRSADELTGASLPSLLHPEDREGWLTALAQAAHHSDLEATVEWRLRRADGSHVPVESRVDNLLDDPAVKGIVLNSRDVSERKRLEDELRHQAFHDSLTGLANRALFGDRLEQGLARLERSRGEIGVLFIDLDDFKSVNDGRGHPVGDELLRAVGKRLSETLRAGETLARLGGDEFGVLIEAGDAGCVAERLLGSLRQPFVLDAGETFVHASIGIATTSDHGDAPSELLRRADVAMYSAKAKGKGLCETFHAGLHDQVIDRLGLEADLGRAVERGELVIHYQPIFALPGEDLVAVEALLRWNHPERGLVAPDQFIPAAEATGHIIAIGRWLLGAASRQICALKQELELPELGLSVNLSARQLTDPGLVDCVKAALVESGLQPECLTLEMTESVFADPRASLPVFERLRDLGVKLSIDDFGTGYSSLAYLQKLPVDELKIDRSFIAASNDGSQESATLVHTIVSLAESFGLQSVAEGIETPAQLEDLSGAGCCRAQGFLLAKPMDANQLLRTLSERRDPQRRHSPQPGSDRSRVRTRVPRDAHTVASRAEDRIR
jgi:diguanylate cyclase (GGDEF)-like protein/PAS domain S-box-containing protein